jgi:hypothetical protein
MIRLTSTRLGCRFYEESIKLLTTASSDIIINNVYPKILPLPIPFMGSTFWETTQTKWYLYKVLWPMQHYARRYWWCLRASPKTTVLVTLGAAVMALTAIAFVVPCASPFVGYSRLKDHFNYAYSKVLSWSNNVVPCADVLRPVFHRMNMFPAHPATNHSHPQSAANRTTASNFMANYATAVGREPFYHQRSRADERNNHSGSRYHYWAKDVPVYPSNLEPQPGSLNCLVDVDYYVDMPDYLARYPVATALYTLSPDDVAGTRQEYSFTFDKQDRMTYSVTGGSRYSHQIWNYTSDCYTVSHKFFGIPYNTVSYLVDRRRVSRDRQVVLFSPIGHWKGIFAMVAWYLSGSTLERLSPNRGSFNRLELMCPERGHVISTSAPGEYVCATVPAQIDETISRLVRTGKHEIASSTIESYLGPVPSEPQMIIERKCKSLLLMECHRLPTTPPDYLCPPNSAAGIYNFGTPNPQDVPVQAPFMTPILPGAYIPLRSRENEQACIDGRVLKQRNTTELDPFTTKCIGEFVNFLVPTPHQGLPLEYEEVLERQSRPTQQRILDYASITLSWPGEKSNNAKSFLKGESYAKVADPRNITIINPNHKLDWSSYTYAIAAHLKTMPWYAFSQTPVEVSDMVVRVCAGKRKVTKSDFSRYDGTIGAVQRATEEAFTLRFFSPAVHVDMLTAQRSQHHMQAVTSLGIAYLTLFSRASGSGETTVFNTLDNAFAAYLTYRTMNYTPALAWGQLCECAFGGDDGLLADVDDAKYEAACARIGLKVKAEPVYSGQMGVCFLARVYGPYVWNGDANSMCDLPRQLLKINISNRLPDSVTPTIKMVEKCRGYVLSDANTPILGPYVKAVTAFATRVPVSAYAGVIRSWNGFDETTNYPNVYNSWMDAEVERVLPDCDPTILQRFVDRATKLADLLNPPSIRACPPHVIDRDVVINGESHHSVLESLPQEQAAVVSVVTPVVPLSITLQPKVSSPKTSSDSKKKHSQKRASAFATTERKFKMPLHEESTPAIPAPQPSPEAPRQYNPDWRARGR